MLTAEWQANAEEKDEQRAEESEEKAGDEHDQEEIDERLVALQSLYLHTLVGEEDEAGRQSQERHQAHHELCRMNNA